MRGLGGAAQRMAPSREGAFCLQAVRFFGETRGVWGRNARRLQAVRYMRMARGVWKRRRGDSVADKPGNSGWDDVQLLVLALACAA